MAIIKDSDTNVIYLRLFINILSGFAIAEGIRNTLFTTICISDQHKSTARFRVLILPRVSNYRPNEGSMGKWWI